MECELVARREAKTRIILLLAAGDLLVLKLVRVMPTWHDKKQAVEISHEIQQHMTPRAIAQKHCHKTVQREQVDHESCGAVHKIVGRFELS